jgi:hypothetical protein
VTNIFEMPRLAEDSNLIAAQCEAFRQQALVAADIQRGLCWHLEQFLKESQGVRQRADELLSSTSWQRRFFMLDASEAKEAQRIWYDLKSGVSGAPRQLKTLPINVQTLILEALAAAMENRFTGDTLLSAFTQSREDPRA